MDEYLQKAMMNPSPAQWEVLRKMRDVGEAGYLPQKREQRSIDCLLERYLIVKQGQRSGVLQYALSPIGLKFLAGAELPELMEMIRRAREVSDPWPIEPVGPVIVDPTPVSDRGGLGPAITQEAFAEQMRRAEETGRQGEEAFATWLEESGHGKQDYICVSRDHARASFDFQVKSPRWEAAPDGLFIDVKATSGGPGGTFHMSAAEVRWAAAHPNYRIARVSEPGSPSPQVQILTGVHEMAAEILASIEGRLSPGVVIDGFEIEPGRLKGVDVRREAGLYDGWSRDGRDGRD